MAYTAEQIQAAISRAKAAGDSAAVADLESRLSETQGNAFLEDDGTAWMGSYKPELTTGGLSLLPESAQAAVLGFGRTLDKFSAGAQDLAGADVAKQQQLRDEAYAPVKEEFPIASTVGEVGPYLATALVPGGLGTQVGIGAALGGTSYAEPEQRVQNAAIDAGLSAIPFGIGKAADSLASSGGRLAKRAQNMKWGLTPGERLDSPGLRNLEASMESFPPTAGPIRRLKANRQKVMNQEALKAIGETGTDLADDTLAGAATRIGEQFDKLIKSKQFDIDDTFLNNLGNVETATRQGIFGGADAEKVIDRILEEASGGTVTGDTLQGWRTALQTQADKAWRSDSTTVDYAKALEGMKESVDDLIKRSLDGKELKEWETARSQWRALKQLENSRAVTETGDVSGRKLANNLSRQDLQGYYRGSNQSELYDAARLSKAYPPMSDSGTAARMSLPMMISAAAMSPVSVPLMGAANVGARMYANPQGLGNALSRVAQGMVPPHLEALKISGRPDERRRSREEMMADIIRNGGF